MNLEKLFLAVLTALSILLGIGFMVFIIEQYAGMVGVIEILICFVCLVYYLYKMQSNE